MYLNQLPLAMSCHALRRPLGVATVFPTRGVHRTGHLATPDGVLSILKPPLSGYRSGSSFPADSAKPVPLAVVSLDSR